MARLFLTNWIQAVNYKNYISDQINVLSCAPQGNKVSPLLSPLFFNNIYIILKYLKYFLLEQDTKMYKKNFNVYGIT